MSFIYVHTSNALTSALYYSSFLQLYPIVSNAKQIGGLNTYLAAIQGMKVGVIYSLYNATKSEWCGRWQDLTPVGPTE